MLTKTLKKILPQSLIDNLLIKSGKKFRILDPHHINKRHLTLHPGAQIVSSGEFIPHLYKTLFNQSPAQNIVPAVNIPLAQSWVPFIKGKSTILLYNFFDRNYGIKDPVLYRLILFNNNAEILSVSCVLLGPGAVQYEDNIIQEGVDPSTIPNETSLLVQAIHPRIKTLGDQLRYFSFYGDSESSLNCGVHSVLVPPRNLGAITPLGHRSYGPAERTSGYSFTQSDQELFSNAYESEPLLKLNSPVPMKSFAYFIHKDERGNPLSVWHDAPNSFSLTKKSHPGKLGPCLTVFSVPEFQDHAPRMMISSSQVGFQPEQLTITATNEKGETLAVENVRINKDNKSVDLKTVFEKHQLRGLITFVVDFHHDIGEFNELPICYVHLYYRSKIGWADQVHSNYTFGYSNTPPQNKKGSFRCRKFAPLIKNSNLEFIYSAINIGGLKTNTDKFVFLRIITDTGFEKRFRWDIKTPGVSHITGRELLEQVGGEINKAAVVLYEHNSTNFQGAWYMVNKQNGALAVDHFTGG